MKILRTASLGSKFTGSYKKVLGARIHEYFSVMVSVND